MSPYIEPARPKPYGSILAAQEAEQVRIKVNDYGPKDSPRAPALAWIDFDLIGGEGQPVILRFRAGAQILPRSARGGENVQLTSEPLPAGEHALVVEAYDENRKLLDRTGSPRIVTVLAAPVEPEPEPDRPAGTITALETAHGTFWRVHPSGVVDAGGEAAGPFEQVEIVEVG